MKDDFDELKQRYQAIKAPAHVATRIRATVADRGGRRRGWMPAAAGVAALLVVALVVQLGLRQQVPEPVSPSIPSLSSLAGMQPAKPGGVAPSLSQLRSVQLPAPPPKPKPAESQTGLRNDTELGEEKDHAFI